MKHNIGTRARGIGNKKITNAFHHTIGMEFVPKIKPFTTQDIITICKCKHYRIGIEGLSNYSRLQELLKSKGMTEDQIKQCLHP